LRGVFFGSRKAIAIQFEEEYAHNKSGSLVAVDKGMVADYSHRISGRQVYGSVTVRMELLRTSQSGLKQPYTSDADSAPIERQKPIMERESITLVNPDGFSHLASEWRVLR
jgi:hypothetical protein